MSSHDTKMRLLYIDQMKSCAEIARILCRSETSIYNELKSMGIIMRNRSEANKIFPDFIFIRLYNMGLSASQIGRLLGVHSSTVVKRLGGLGFPLRSRDVAVSIRYTEEEFQRHFMTTEVLGKLAVLV